MRRLRLAFVFASIAGSGPFAYAAKIRVRGAELSFPLNLKILIRQQESDVVVAGTELRDGDGAFIGDQPLECAFTQGSQTANLLEKVGTKGLGYWTCKSGNYQRVLDRTLRIIPRAGFVSVGKEMFRGAIDLVPKGDRLAIVNELELEVYLAGLVNKEFRSDWPAEAVKAQIIAARSYALATVADRRRAGEEFDLHGSEIDQVYQGVDVEDARSFRLVRETQDQVLLHRNDVLRAYYHSSSGGFSEHPDQVWGRTPIGERDAMAFLARPSPEDAALKTDWSVTLGAKMGLAWPEIGEIEDIRVMERTPGQRVKTLRIAGKAGTRTMSGADLRKRLGPRWLKSTLFTVKRTGNSWVFAGRGWGHGVGLSQMGAKAMAKKGKRFAEILSFYYPYAHVEKLKPHDVVDDELPARAR